MFPEFEEDSLVNASIDSFAELSDNFSESVSEIKKNMQLMIKYKKEGINDRETYQQLRTRGCLQIAILKRLNRFAQMGAKQIREKTKVCKVKSNFQSFFCRTVIDSQYLTFATWSRSKT